MAGAFEQPPLPGYSPWPQARQESPFLHIPGAQGLQEGVAAGQGLAFSPQQEFFSGGTEGTAPPSSIPPMPNMWEKFGGSGGAPSSLAQPMHEPVMQPQNAPMMQPAQGPTIQPMQPPQGIGNTAAPTLQATPTTYAGGGFMHAPVASPFRPQ